jgi:hypothetical protein
MASQSLQILYTFVLHAEIATGRTQYKSIQNTILLILVCSSRENTFFA